MGVYNVDEVIQFIMSIVDWKLKKIWLSNETGNLILRARKNQPWAKGLLSKTVRNVHYVYLAHIFPVLLLYHGCLQSHTS